MSLAELKVLGRHEALAWYAAAGPLRGVVSIADPGAAPVHWHALDCPVLHLAFTDSDGSGRPGAARGPCSSHLLALRDFAVQLRPRAGTCLVHCEAGLSRGPAVAWILGCLLDGPGSEVPHLRAILAQRPGAAPNPWLVTLAQRQFRVFDFATPLRRGAVLRR